MEKFVLIMAGGVGSRFWPRSRKKLPKQLLNIFGQNSMIQDTVERLKGFVDEKNILIITNKVQKALIEEQLPNLPKENVIAEPVGRNTAPCVALAASVISKKSKDAVFVTLPADHLINPKEDFHSALNLGCDFAYQSKGLVTFGIKPTRPDTGYGYINFEKNETKEGIHKVIKFVEKPNLEKANEYLASGDYLWNSGMFIWRADVILDEINQHLNGIYNGIEKLDTSKIDYEFYQKLDEIYPALDNISIDYGIMEKSDKVYCIQGDFNWSDVGSWETVFELTEKSENNNALVGDVYIDSSNDNYVYNPNKFTALIGIENTVVIDTNDALLVCSRDKVQDVKKIVDYLNEKNKTDLV